MTIGAELIREMYSQIEKNWTSSTNKPTPSKELWVPRRTLKWSEDFKSAEVPLERSAVALFKFYDVLRERIDTNPNRHLTWFNQIPVACGIVSKRETRNAIDLVCRTGKGVYDFVELKFPKQEHSSEMPLNATVEILKNGVLYLFTRRRLRDLEKQNKGYKPQLAKENGEQAKEPKETFVPREILEANEINLCVLAPEYFYYRFNLAWLEEELNEGLREFLKINTVQGLTRITFRYESLPNRPFEITGQNGFRLDFTRQHLDWNVVRTKSFLKP